MHWWLAFALLETSATVPKDLRPLGKVPSVGTVPSAPRVTCTVRDDVRQRVYELTETPAAWQLSMRDTESGARWIRLSLRGAEPRIALGTASLAYKNANGGRIVTLEVKPGRATLDVFVDHGLEVNIEPDLDPAVDRMTTNGPLTSLDCTVEPQ